MKYDVIKKELYTESGVFIKTLHCPYKRNWNELKIISDLVGIKVMPGDYQVVTLFGTVRI